MQVIHEPARLAELLDQARADGGRVGLVPTMGALHAGHQTLIRRAAAECDVVAVTVFVNPLQFDDAADLAAYPRTFPEDAVVAESAGATYLFAPSVAEMYPEHPRPPATTVHVAGLGHQFEGASRPGHFDGVATVVTKLLALAGRCRAYFGEKDFQQLVVVRRLVADLCLPVEVVGCPTWREPDGLATSSRNTRLTAEQRAVAPALFASLRRAVELVEAGERQPAVLRQAMAAELGRHEEVVVDYAEVVDPVTFAVPDRLTGPARLVVAARIGDVRLIDNLGVDATVPAAFSPADPRSGSAAVLVSGRSM